MKSIGPMIRRIALALLIASFFITPLILRTQIQSVSAAQTIVDSTNPNLVFQGNWYTYPHAQAYNYSYKYTSSWGATVSYPFYGSAITYLYTMAFNRGAVEVYIDDVIVDYINNHVDDRTNDNTKIPRHQTAKTYSFPNGNHEIMLKAIPGDDGGRIYVDLDAFIINPDKASIGTYDDTTAYATEFEASQWHSWPCGECYNGNYQYTDVAGAGVRFTFEGDSVTWYFTKAYNRGKVGVTIDGENKNWYYGYYDLYSPTIKPNQSKTFNGLGGGTHTIVIYNIHQKNPASSHYYIDFDKFVVGSSNSYRRTTAASYADARTHTYNCNYYDNTYGCYIESNDCMNLSSQVMKAGGFPYIPANPPWHNWETEWYYDATNQFYSQTWRYVPSFMTYQAGRPSEFSRTSYITTLRRGDLIPLDLRMQDGTPGQDGFADHMRVVVGAGLSSPFYNDYDYDLELVTNPVFDMLVDQHSIDRWQVPWDYKLTGPEILDFIHIIKN
jgi:hypothetical protein